MQRTPSDPPGHLPHLRRGDTFIRGNRSVGVATRLLFEEAGGELSEVGHEIREDSQQEDPDDR